MPIRRPGNAGPNAAEVAQLRDDLAALTVEFGQLRTQFATAQATRTQLEEQKLRADKDKVEAEERKINAELAPRLHNYERGGNELVKLGLEIRKLRVDRHTARWTPWIELAKVIAGFILAIGAIGTFWVGFEGRQAETKGRVDADVVRLVDGLAADKPIQRATAASGLQAYLENPSYRPLVLDGLIVALSLEDTRYVQDAIRASLVKAGPDVTPRLKNLRDRVDGEIIADFNTLADARSRGETIRVDAMLATITARETSQVSIALALQALDGNPLDFSGLTFTKFEFLGAGVRLRGASFRGAILEQSDLYRRDLKEVDFSNSDASRASFGKALFDDHTLFSGADLSCANFTDATGLDETQLRKAKSLAGAIVPNQLVTVLKDRLLPPPPEGCAND
jgi:hypothetical protein